MKDRSSRWLGVVAAVLGGCASPMVSNEDGASGSDASADVGAGEGGASGEVQLRPHAVNIVDPEAAAEVAQYVRGDSRELYRAAASFYARFRDEYDFVYIFTDGPIESGGVSARFTLARRPAIEGTGITRASTNAMYPPEATKLRGVIGVNFNAVGNGPTLHETLHYWSMFLSPTFGFGRDRDQSFGAHWGVASVDGQHGGFDLSTAQCNNPAGAALPNCMPDPDGITRVTIGSFGPNANGGDSRPFAPIELYLMGLVPKAEAGGPFTVLDGAHFVSADPMTRRLTFEITGTHTVSLDDIVGVHGARPPAGPEDRAFRGAFVVFSAAPVSAQRMDALERWASIFGNDTMSAQLYSFERATGGRATLSTRLGAMR
jgi:hypothetical protein